MNDSTDNPFDLPHIDKEDIPVLDDIVTPGSVQENRTPVIPEQATPGLADYSFDTNAIPTDENSFTEEITPEEIHGISGHVALDTGFTIEDQNNASINEANINIANELHIDIEQLTELIEQITTEVQHKLESKIEGSIKQSMEDNLNNILHHHKEIIKESIRTHLIEQLPDILNDIPPKQEN